MSEVGLSLTGVLLKLLEEMDAEKNSSGENRKPVLLQIRSIIPILKNGNLWPNHGFYLRVADLTHAIYASLPHDQLVMILDNRLQLGQYIYVERLEKACPVPVLIGLTPIPGRHFCVGKPKDLLSYNFLQYAENDASDAEIKNVAVENNVTKKEPLKKSYSRKGRKRDPRSFEDEGSDSDCSNLSTVSAVSRASRRNWKSSDLSTIKEITETTVMKHKTKSTIAYRDTSVSPSHYGWYNSYDEKSCAKLERKRSDPHPRRVAKSPTKSDVFSNKHLVSIQPIAESQSTPSEDKAGRGGDICWDSMSPTLFKIGKAVQRQRDLALLASAEALQEAAVAERLLKSLSTVSDFQSTSLDNSQQLVDSFLKHQENFTQTRLIIRSLTDVSSPSENGTSKDNSSVKEVFDREKQAAEWAKAAVAFDLSTHSLPAQPPIITSYNVTPTITTSPPKPSPSPKQKFPSLFRRSRKNRCITSADSYTDSNNQDDSTKGKRSSLPALTSLANSLEAECRKRFLTNIEKYIDEIKSGTISSDCQTVSIMNQLNRVNDWLDTITRDQPDSNRHKLETWEVQACGRVRNKIIVFLLNHVTRAALTSGASDTRT